MILEWMLALDGDALAFGFGIRYGFCNNRKVIKDKDRLQIDNLAPAY